MRKFLFFLLLTAVAVSGVSGANKEKRNKKNKEKKEVVAEEVLLVSEELPRFKRGSFEVWVKDNLTYPQGALRNRQVGRVMVSFVINSKGEVGDVSVKKSSGYPLLDREAVRVASMSPKWIPGRTKGEAVAVRMNFPVNFSMPR